MKYQTIGIDLDGTLLNSNKSISVENVRTLKKFKDEGGKIMVVSGRHYFEIERFLHEYDLYNYVAYCVSCDGLYVHDSQGKLIFKNYTLKSSDVLEIMRLSHVSKIEAYTDKKDYVFTSSLYQWVKCSFKYLVKHKGNACILKWFLLFGNKEFEKCAVNDAVIEPSQRETIRDKYKVHCLVGDRYEFIHKECGKYQALKKMSELKLFDIDAFLYFGDDYNDEECFKRLPASVVMGNAPENLKKYSIFRALSNDEDGVSDALNRLVNVG